MLGRERNEELVFSGYRISVLEDKSSRDSSGDCIILKMGRMVNLM